MSISTLIQFARPHTIIGSLLSITALYLIACGSVGVITAFDTYLWVLVAALACNIFIVGLNQWYDIDLDKINKPNLPLASGELSTTMGKRIIWICFGMSMLIPALLSWHLFTIIASINLIGYLYSAPPVRLKKYHLTAALCITGVRGLIVNLGIGYWFATKMGDYDIAKPIIYAITIFVTLFSIAIAWFKDLYDVEGDRAFHINTFPIKFSQKMALLLGNGLVLIGYFIILILVRDQGRILFGGHLVLLGMYILFIVRSKTQEPSGIYKFYMGFWVFFFAEYLLFITHSLATLI